MQHTHHSAYKPPHKSQWTNSEVKAQDSVSPRDSLETVFFVCWSWGCCLCHWQSQPLTLFETFVKWQSSFSVIYFVLLSSTNVNIHIIISDTSVTDVHFYTKWYASFLDMCWPWSLVLLFWGPVYLSWSRMALHCQHHCWHITSVTAVLPVWQVSYRAPLLHRKLQFRCTQYRYGTVHLHFIYVSSLQHK